MTTPQAGNNRRGPRKQNRSPKSTPIPINDGTSEADGAAIRNTTPKTPPSRVSPTSAMFTPNTERPLNVNEDGTEKKKRRQPKKQQQPVPFLDATPPSVSDQSPYHRKANSQNAVLFAESNNTTPLKQAYAGPTFHASPAASSLPMPSFLAKHANKGDGSKNNRKESKTVDSPQDKSTSEEKAQEMEASPLDFLFKAALAANAAQHPDPPRHWSESDLVHTRAFSNAPASRDDSDSPSQTRHHTRSSTDASVGEVFPLEMDGSSTPGMAIGPAFATPYKARMDALRSGDTPTRTATYDSEEEQRRSKTDALKRLLMTPQPQRPASASARLREVTSPFDPLPPSTNGVSQRHTSGPSTPISYNVNRHGLQNTYPQYSLQQQSHKPYANGSPKPRTPSSNLRQEITPASPAVELPAPQFQPSTQSTPRGTPASAEKSAAAKSMEDDLRRILNLDVTN